MVIRTAASALALLLSGTAAAHATSAVCSARLLPHAVRAAVGKRSLTAQDLIELRDFGEFSVSPDGRFAALLLRRANIATDNYCIGLVVVPLGSGGTPRLLDVGGEPLPSRTDLSGVADIANGAIAGTGPAWSPDGRAIAYLRRDQGVTQVWIAKPGGGRHQLTKVADDARGVTWGSSRIVRVSVRPTAAANAAITAEGRTGYLYDRRFWAVSEVRPNPPPVPIETVEYDASTGRPLAASTSPKEAGRPPSAQLFVRLPDGGIAWTKPKSTTRYASPAVLNVDFRGNRLVCGDACASRVSGLWASGNILFFLRSGSPDNGGRVELFLWDLVRDAAPRRVLTTVDALSSCTLTDAGLICARETAVHPRTLVIINPLNGSVTTLWDPNPEISQLVRTTVTRLRWTAADGISSYGDLVLPPSYRGEEKLPLIIVQYISRGFLRGGVGDEYPIHLFATQGFAVLSVTRPNMPSDEVDAPDVDSSQRVNVNGWADRRRVQASLDAGIDAVIKLGAGDPARIGITGLSDGSATVQFALINSRRFRAASMTTCCESNGSGIAVGLAYSDSLTRRGYPAPGTNSSEFWAPYSLAQNAGRIRTPLLIQAADHEYRLALETYAALDAAKAPVEMYVFPDEHHVKMHPEHRLAVYKRNLAWFDFWLKGRQDLELETQQTMARWQGIRSALADK